MISDEKLRINHEFVTAFETLRKRHGFKEVDDAAVRHIAEAIGLEYETLRIARHLRNALAHDEPVNRDNLIRYLQILTGVRGRPKPAATQFGTSSLPERRAYRVHAWKDPQLEREMIANGFVSVGGEEIGDLAGVGDAEVIRSWLTESMPSHTPRAIALFVGYWRRFLWDARVGDVVVLPTRTREVAVGEFVGPYHYVPTVDARARHRRAVSWNVVDVKREAFGPDLLVTLNGQHTVQDFLAVDAVPRLRMLAEGGIDHGPRRPT